MRFTFKMKHLFMISILILLFETGLFLTYNFLYLHLANTGVNHWVNVRSMQTDIIILSTNLCLLLIIWIAFILYYRYSLPKEIMNLIIGNENKNPTDTLVKHLQGEIKNYYEQKNIMITALAHDIKTPLTEAILRLALLDEQKEAEEIRLKLEEVNNIITSSLDYARQPEKMKMVRADVVSLIETIAESYNKTDGFIVHFHSQVFSFIMDIELQLFKRMITNIIENSKKYATSCNLTIIQWERDKIVITCEDDGPGVPEQFLHLLAIPYFRVDQSRSSSTGGTGLGLAIVKKIAELHNGLVTFTNSPGGGFVVNIILERIRHKPRKHRKGKTPS